MENRCICRAGLPRFVLVAVLLFPMVAFAANPWFTGRTMDGRTTPLSALRAAPEAGTNIASISLAGVSGGLIDLVVSLHNRPKGDNNGNAQGGADNEEQDKYEKIFQYMADSIYEMTEGGHRVRNVRIFTAGDQANHADIVWHDSGQPHVPWGGGVSMPGGHINMYDYFTLTANGSLVTDCVLIVDLEGAGYTTGHEMGHYFYGLYDEYKLQNGDIVVKPAIMNRQWSARGGDFRWLNLSIAYQAANPSGDYVNTKKTEQHRQYGKSCWETLAGATASDPTNNGLGTRVYYPEVAALAPTGTMAPTVNLPNAAAREKLNIIWMGSNNVFVICLDRSISMEPPYTDKDQFPVMKMAAGMLIDSIKSNDYVCLVDFAGYAFTRVEITQLTSAAVRASIKTQINNLWTASGTAIGDALQLGLNALLAFTVSNANKAVFLLTDGQSNSGIAPLSVIPAYQAAQIPIITFGYGSHPEFIDFATLQTLSGATGGRFYQSPTSLAQISGAFRDAGAYASSAASIDAQNVALKDASGRTARVSIKIPVDATLSAFDIAVTYHGLSNESALVLSGPRRRKVAPASVQSSSSETLVHFVVEDARAGNWRLKGTVPACGMLSYSIVGQQNQQTYTLDASSPGGGTVVFPTQTVIRAVLQKDLQIKNARVAAEVTAPNGDIWPVDLENVMGGVYEGAFIAYATSGVYTVNVLARSTRKCALTYDGAFRALPQSMDEQVPRKDERVRDKFQRAASFSITVAGVGYSPAGSGTPALPAFLWPVAQSAKYRIEVQQWDTAGAAWSEAFSVKVAAKRRYPYVPRKPLAPGTYQWRVSEVVKGKADPVWSPWTGFVIP